MEGHYAGMRGTNLSVSSIDEMSSYVTLLSFGTLCRGSVSKLGFALSGIHSVTVDLVSDVAQCATECRRCGEILCQLRFECSSRHHILMR